MLFRIKQATIAIAPLSPPVSLFNIMGCQGSKAVAAPKQPSDQQTEAATLLQTPASEIKTERPEETTVETTPLEESSAAPVNEATPNASTAKAVEITGNIQMPKSTQVVPDATATKDQDVKSAVEASISQESAATPVTATEAADENVAPIAAADESAASDEAKKPSNDELGSAVEQGTPAEAAVTTEAASVEKQSTNEVVIAPAAIEVSAEDAVEAAAEKEVPVTPEVSEVLSKAAAATKDANFTSSEETIEVTEEKGEVAETEVSKAVISSGCCSRYCRATEVQSEIVF